MPENASAEGKPTTWVRHLGDSTLGQVLENLPVAAYTCDAEGLITFYNQQAVRLWGRAPKLNDPVDRFCGSFKLFSASGAPIAHDRCCMALALQTGQEFFGHEIVIERPDGQRAAALAHINLSRDESGRLLGATNVVVDVTERKRAEQEVRDASWLLRRVLDTIPAMVGILAPDGTILDGNQLPLDTFGVQLEKVIGRPFADIYPFSSSPAVQAELREALRRAGVGESVRYDVELPTPSGRSVVVDLWITPINDEAGRVTHLIPSGVDITERQRAETALRESEARYRNLVQTTHDLIWAVDAQGRITFINQAARDIYGYEPEELIGRCYFDFLSPEELARQIEAFQKTLASEEKVLFGQECEVLHRNGRRRILLANAVILRDEGGNPSGAMGTSVDITGRKQSEEALRAVELKLREQFAELEQLYRTAPIGLSLMDRELRYLRINDRLAAINGHPASDHIGRTLREMIPEIATEVEAIYRRVIDTNEPVRDVEIHGATPAQPGIERDWVCQYYPVKKDDGAVIAVSAVVLEVTERKHAEKRLHALSRRILTVREEERGRLARELHDGISQTLTALALAFEIGINAPPPIRSAKLDEARAFLEKGLRQARELANDLRPPMLDHLGLLPAVLWLIERIKKKAKLAIHFLHSGLAARFAPAVETVAYRLVEEALTNVDQHANVDAVSVRIWVQNDLLNVQIEDEGAGFPRDATLISTNGIELACIQEQVEFLGGTLVILSGLGDGTSLLAQLPVETRPKD